MTLLQFASAAGAEVWVTSGSEEKLGRAKELGARGGALYSQINWQEDLAQRAGFFNLILDSAGGPGFNALLDLVRPGGRLVFYGATQGNPPEFPLRKAYWKQVDLLGTTLGSPREFTAMLARVRDTRWRPVMDCVLPWNRLQDGFARMEAGRQTGKIVFRIS